MDPKTAQSTLQTLISQKENELDSLKVALALLNNTFQVDLTALEQAQAEADVERTKTSMAERKALDVEAEKNTEIADKEVIIENLTAEKADKDMVIETLVAEKANLQAEVEDLVAKNIALKEVKPVVEEVLPVEEQIKEILPVEEIIK